MSVRHLATGALLCAVLGASSAAGGAGVGGTVPAEVAAWRDARVPAQVAGVVLTRRETSSAAVRAGDTVVTLDDTLYRAQARAARAELARAEAKRDWAALDLARVKALFAKGTVDKAALDKSEIGDRDAKAAVEAAKAASDEAQARLDRTRIRAPFPGRIVRIYPEVGEYLQPGQTAFRLVDESALRIVFFLPADLVSRVRAGDRVSLLPATPGEEAGEKAVPQKEGAAFAVVVSVAPAAEGRARTFRVEAKAEPGPFLPGTAARVGIPDRQDR